MANIDTLDTERLNNIIKSKGVKKNYLASVLGISNQAFQNKMNGKTLFKVTEIVKIANVIGLSKEDIYNIFFAPLVDNS